MPASRLRKFWGSSWVAEREVRLAKSTQDLVEHGVYVAFGAIPSSAIGACGMHGGALVSRLTLTQSGTYNRDKVSLRRRCLRDEVLRCFTPFQGPLDRLIPIPPRCLILRPPIKPSRATNPY